MTQLLKKAIELPLDLLNDMYIKSYYKKGIKCPDMRVDDLKDEKTIILADEFESETIGLGGTLLKSKTLNSEKTLVYITNQDKYSEEEESILMEKIKKLYNIGEIVRIKDDDASSSEKLVDLLRKVSPSRIYTPFLFNGSERQIRVTKILLEALKMYDTEFRNIWMYESSTPNDLRIINRLISLNKEEYMQKTEIYLNFKRNRNEDFDAYGVIDRNKALLLGDTRVYAAETFIKLSYKSAKDAEKILLDKGFKSDDIYGFTNKMNLLSAFLKKKNKRILYNNNLNYALKASFIESQEEDYGL